MYVCVRKKKKEERKKDANEQKNERRQQMFISACVSAIFFSPFIKFAGTIKMCPFTLT